MGCATSSHGCLIVPVIRVTGETSPAVDPGTTTICDCAHNPDPFCPARKSLPMFRLRICSRARFIFSEAFNPHLAGANRNWHLGC